MRKGRRGKGEGSGDNREEELMRRGEEDEGIITINYDTIAFVPVRNRSEKEMVSYKNRTISISVIA